VRSGPGEARTILLLHIISVRPSNQPLMVRTFLKVYMELGSYFFVSRTNKRHHHHPGAGSQNKLSGWVDSDFASDIDTGKSMTGYLMVLNGGPISWKASRQGDKGGVFVRAVVRRSSSLQRASQAGQEVLYLRALLKGFAYLQHGPTEIWGDNAYCILVSENPANRERSRHVDVRVHFLQDMVRDGSVKLIKCACTQNVADALTKSLPRPAFHKHREFLKGTAQSFSAFFASAYQPAVPAYVTNQLCRPTSRKGAAFPSSKPLQSVSVDR
jgi:hypothetical protein